MNNFLKQLQTKILVFDGAMGVSLQNQNLSVDDFGGKEFEGCNEYLLVSKPSAVEKVHEGFLSVGCDVIETDTFGGAGIVLAEYNLQSRAYELNFKSAQLAKKMANGFSTKEKPRFVAGSIGPTTKLPSLGHITFREMQKSFYEQTAGLIEGGVDVLCVETCQDILQAKSALAAMYDYFLEKKIRMPVIVSVTIETMGTMLMGTEISAALTAIEPYDIVDVIGMNCATGPKEMEENVRYLCQNSPKHVFVMPNAGLPENVGGKACYHLSPDELEHWMKHFVNDLGVNIIGGCCGTTPEHIARLVRIANEKNGLGLEIGGLGEKPQTTNHKPRTTSYIPSCSSIYSSQTLHVEPAPLLIGERCNANGSKKFRELLLEENYDAMVQMAKEQVQEGAHVLDVCVAYVGRDEVRDMREVMRRFNTQVTIPMMIDSTEINVIEEALQHCAGRAIINSINLEDGEERMAHVLPLCKKYGAAVVALTIDEKGMAKTAQAKFEIAKRIRDLAVDKYGMRDEDLIFDTLTFTLGSGDDEFRKSAMATIDAIRLIKQAYPKCYTSLGVSNVSFGLNAHLRHVLNSVFLHYAIEAGLDMAIVHASKIMPLYKIEEKGRELCKELIFDERKFEVV
ncbi:MAG: homocysteine S-methyltransferase family protein [Bacteroidota bacterium]